MHPRKQSQRLHLSAVTLGTIATALVIGTRFALSDAPASTNSVIVLSEHRTWKDLRRAVYPLSTPRKLAALSPRDQGHLIFEISPAQVDHAPGHLTLSIAKGLLQIDSEEHDTKSAIIAIKEYLSLSMAAGDETSIHLIVGDSEDTATVSRVLADIFAGKESFPRKLYAPQLSKSDSGPPSSNVRWRYTSDYIDDSPEITLVNAVRQDRINDIHRLKNGFGGSLEPLLAFGRFRRSDIRSRRVLFTHVYDAQPDGGSREGFRDPLTIAEGQVDTRGGRFKGDLDVKTQFVKRLPAKADLMAIRRWADVERIFALNPSARLVSVSSGIHRANLFTLDPENVIRVCTLEASLDLDGDTPAIYNCIVHYGEFDSIGTPELRVVQ